ncbi:MAG: hypothetical protein QXE76_02815 [Candidatus Bathyarchaeia archaeon]
MGMGAISELTNEDIQILKNINQLKTPTAKELANKLGEPYTETDLAAYLTILEQKKLVKSFGDYTRQYMLSGLGLIAIGILSRQAQILFDKVPSQKCFHFFLGIGPDKSLGVSACNLWELKEKVETVDVRSLEFHVSRGDLEKWCRDVLGEDKLAAQITHVRQLGLKGMSLRNKLSEIIYNRIKELAKPFENLSELQP